jgi:hypothetical protein
MNAATSPEDLLRATLRAEAEDAHEAVAFEDVRRAALRRRHTGRRTAVLAAAAVVVAIGAPTAFLLHPAGNDPSPAPAPSPSTSTRVPTPTPTPSGPTVAPSGGVLVSIPKGPAPGITYLQDGTVHLPDGSTTRLPDPTAPVIDFTSYHGGWLTGLGAGADRVRWYDNTGTQQFESPDVGTLAVSEDGTRTAYARDGAIHIGISSGMGEGEQTLPVRADRFWPIGFLRGDRLVYQADDKVIVDGGRALPGMVLGRAVCAEADLVAGEDQSGKTLVVSRQGDVVWTSTDWAVWGFSSDGRYAAATNSPTGGEFSSLAILDARTGQVLARHDVLRDGITLGGRPFMDTDGTLLAAATDSDTLDQTVLRLDQDGTLTRATAVFPLDPASDSTAVVFATRP